MMIRILHRRKADDDRVKAMTKIIVPVVTAAVEAEVWNDLGLVKKQKRRRAEVD